MIFTFTTEPALAEHLALKPAPVHGVEHVTVMSESLS